MWLLIPVIIFTASFTVISAKAVSGMLQLTMAGKMQMQYPVFWIMLIVMATTAIAQVKSVTKLYDELK